MTNSIDLAEIGALVGDPARAAMLLTLMDGRALTAGELAYCARISPQTASAHLKRLAETNLLSVLRQGRNRYFRIASPRVAKMMEAIGTVAAVDAPPRRRPVTCRDAAVREARLCYDHLAGRLAVLIAEAMTERKLIMLDEDGGEVTPAGFRFFDRIGIDLEVARRGKRAFCRPCLDWSERRFHLAGHTGAALASHAFDQGWLARVKDSRAVRLTDEGRAAFTDLLGITAAALAEAA